MVRTGAASPGSVGFEPMTRGETVTPEGWDTYSHRGIGHVETAGQEIESDSTVSYQHLTHMSPTPSQPS